MTNISEKAMQCEGSNWDLFSKSVFIPKKSPISNILI